MIDATVIPAPTPLELAIIWARSFHEGQAHGHRPFIQHVSEVVGVLKRFGADTEDLLVAAWLHDVVEDTPATLDHVEEHFGSRIRELVDALTDVTREELLDALPEEEKLGAQFNRAARKSATLLKTAACPGARIVKLADRIANVEYTIASGEKKFLRMYQQEREEFERMLYLPTTGTQLNMQRHLSHLLNIVL